MCADAAKNDCLTLLNHCVEGVPTFEEIVADKVAGKTTSDNNVVDFSYFATKNYPPGAESRV